mmetsp:Transcript_78323/g.254419  ORF Transcript_78323/g.254419 Transcript_78323/m.254419 type:complete len:359 (+) Transcript_78323:520-1596(+)
MALLRLLCQSRLPPHAPQLDGRALLLPPSLLLAGLADMAEQTSEAGVATLLMVECARLALAVAVRRGAHRHLGLLQWTFAVPAARLVRGLVRALEEGRGAAVPGAGQPGLMSDSGLAPEGQVVEGVGDFGETRRAFGLPETDLAGSLGATARGATRPRSCQPHDLGRVQRRRRQTRGEVMGRRGDVRRVHGRHCSHRRQWGRQLFRHTHMARMAYMGHMRHVAHLAHAAEHDTGTATTQVGCRRDAHVPRRRRRRRRLSKLCRRAGHDVRGHPPAHRHLCPGAPQRGGRGRGRGRGAHAGFAGAKHGLSLHAQVPQVLEDGGDTLLLLYTGHPHRARRARSMLLRRRRHAGSKARLRT